MPPGRTTGAGGDPHTWSEASQGWVGLGGEVLLPSVQLIGGGGGREGRLQCLPIFCGVGMLTRLILSGSWRQVTGKSRSQEQD